MMDYSPINFRRIHWSSFNPNEKYGWRDIMNNLDSSQAALVRESYRGHDLPSTDYREPRSYLSYYLE